MEMLVTEDQKLEIVEGHKFVYVQKCFEGLYCPEAT